MSLLGTVTVIADEVIEVGVRLSLPKVTVVAGTNPEPLIVRARGPDSARADVGDRLLMEGAGSLTVKLTEAELPPFPGFVTVTTTVPAV